MSPNMRPSPFARPTTPSTVRAQSPQTSPTKDHASPNQPTSPLLSPERPERQSPFVRRPSQLGSQRASSPFARPPSRLNVTSTPEPPSPDLSSPIKDRIVEPVPFNLPTDKTQTSGQSRPSVARTVTASSTTTVRATNTTTQPPQSQSTGQVQSHTQPPQPHTIRRPATSSYKNVPQALLHSLRESFEVLDDQQKGHITPSDVSRMLKSLDPDADASPAVISSFFPTSDPHASAKDQRQLLSLSKFLDKVTAPLADFSEMDELTAAFAAFDTDDSGQIDLVALRDAVVDCVPERADQKVSEAQVDAILQEFKGRRAFGARGISGREMSGLGGFAGSGTAGRGDVFKYKDFVGAINGAGAATTV